MIYRHLISCGYTESSSNMLRECNLDLDKWEIADNIDFYYMLQDFEDYYEMRFMRKPVLVKKAPEVNEKRRGIPLPGSNNSKNERGSSASNGSLPTTNASE